MTNILTNTLAALTMVAATAWAQPASPDFTLQCNENGWRTNSLETFCKLVDFSAPYIGPLVVKSGNGAVTVRGWDGQDILVRAQIQTTGHTAFDAEWLAAQILLDVSGTLIKASGPETTDFSGWAVNWEIFVPRTVTLTLKVGNGAVSIADVTGQIDSSVGNGAVSLTRLAGQVEASVGNGAVTVTLGGDHWEGAGLRVKGGNGAFSINAAHGYSAHFDASTGIGVISTNYPVTIPKSKWSIPGLGCTLTFDSNSGGAPIRLTTGIGTIRIAFESGK